MGRGPVEVRAVCESVLADLAGAFAESAVVGSREQWAGVIGAAQAVLNAATAVQDAAIAQLAAIEPAWCEDGTEVESHRGLGHVALDAPAIVSGVLSTSAGHAQRRVRTAVRLAADGPAGTDTATGLGGVHAAMRAGRLDPYRAAVLVEELEHAPAQVAATVVAAVQGHFGTDDGAWLRRRCRRVLARISPDLLHQRAARARAQCGLRRWADEPGVDRWEGTFPSEEAAQAWAAIDALARQYVTDGRCPSIERARAKALTDLVAGHATIDTVLTITVPATALPDTRPSSGSETTPTGPAGARPDADTRVEAGSREGRGAWAEAAAPAPGPVAQPVSHTTGQGDLVEVTGPTGGNPVLVSRQWLADTVDSASTVQVAPCHPVTGALLERDTTATDHDPVDTGAAAAVEHGADRYRPPARMVTRVKARDRRCRFPGCAIAAVFCDLDHVRPFPAGPTRDDNLVCLCRRHHRIKQRPGWACTLTPDAVATWTDPTGAVRTTHPVDALHTTVLTANTGAAAVPVPQTADTSRARTVIPDGPHSELEFRLEHLSAPPPAPPRPPRRARPPRAVTTWRDHHGRPHRIDLLPPPATLLLDDTGHWPHRRTRARQPDDSDLPPF